MAFFSQHELRKIPGAGGAAVKIAAAPTSFGAVWDEADHIYVSQPGSLSRVSSSGGEPETILEGLQELLPRWVDYRVSSVPGGRWLLLSILATDGRYLMIVYDLEGGETRVLGEGVGPRLLSTGHLLFGRNNTLFAVRFDNRKAELLGEPTVVLEGVDVDWMGYPLFAVADEGGTLAYVPAGAVAEERWW